MEDIKKQAILKIEFGSSSDLRTQASDEETTKLDFRLKTRDEHMKEMRGYNREDCQLDILIIGGGALGCGVAIEAASRGLKCGVVDANDFGTGSSSRSTKLGSGGMRNFEKMMKLEGDPFANYRILKASMNERNYFLECAPYLN
jgi:glycerol-3-phosphate dehydrogenase